MRKYHLIRHSGNWRLIRNGAKRALVDFGSDDFDLVLSVVMTNAKDMESLTIHNDEGLVVHKFDREFIKLWESN